MAKPNAETSLMRVTKNAVSKTSNGTTLRSVDVILSPSGPVPMVIASNRTTSATVKHNAQTVLMKETRFVVSKASSNTTRRSVDVTLRLNGLVPTANASIDPKNVTENTSALTNLTREINAASEVSSNTTRRSVAATLRLNLPVLTVNALNSERHVMALKANALISLMTPLKNVVSKDSNRTLPKSVVVRKTNGNVLTLHVSASLVDVMEANSAKTNLMN
jgi:hypothetical protein